MDSHGPESLGRICSHNIRVTDHDFADDTVIFTQSQGFLLKALEAPHEKLKSIGLKVSWDKIESQAFGGLLDEAASTAYVCGENTEIGSSIYLGSLIYNNGGSYQKVLQWIGIDGTCAGQKLKY